MAFTVNNFCFCADLRSGSYVIGFINLLWSIAALIIFGLAIGAAVFIQATGLVVLFAVHLTIYAARIFFIILLLIGIFKHQRKHVQSFFIFSACFTGVNIIFFIIEILFGTTILIIILSVFDIVISIYFLIVIRSYYLTMNESNPANQPVMYLQPQQYPIQTQQYPMQTQQYPMQNQQYPMQDLQYPVQAYPTQQHGPVVMARQEKQQV